MTLLSSNTNLQNQIASDSFPPDSAIMQYPQFCQGLHIRKLRMVNSYLLHITASIAHNNKNRKANNELQILSILFPTLACSELKNKEKKGQS